MKYNGEECNNVMANKAESVWPANEKLAYPWRRKPMLCLAAKASNEEKLIPVTETLSWIEAER